VFLDPGIGSNALYRFPMSERESAALSEILCAGLACVDIELLGCTVPRTVESIAPFRTPRYTAGGSAAQASRALAVLGFRTAAAYAAADDAHGRALVDMLRTEHVEPIPASSEGDTPLAVLPVFDDGRRACFVSLGAAQTITQEALVPNAILHAHLRAFHFGYPHLLPKLQGTALHKLLSRVRRKAPHALISLDVNGALTAEDCAQVLRPALRLVDIMHANLEEACVISALYDPAKSLLLKKNDAHALVDWFLREGAAVCCVTCGRDGVFAGSVRIRDSDKRTSLVLHRPAFSLLCGTAVNTSGAGDAFASGALAGMMTTQPQPGVPVSLSAKDLADIADSGLASAVNRLDGAFGHKEFKSQRHPIMIDALVSNLLERSRIHPRTELL
jgi:sugar/nucleoside kinase (ribokinase family)